MFTAPTSGIYQVEVRNTDVTERRAMVQGKDWKSTSYFVGVDKAYYYEYRENLVVL
tara:strand:- start:1564 stop:1731 length:168 start_codon:yes stop_codon:yes gene_type:complete